MMDEYAITGLHIAVMIVILCAAVMSVVMTVEIVGDLLKKWRRR